MSENNYLTLTILDEEHGFALCEILNPTRPRENRFHVVSIDHDERRETT